MEQFPLNIIPRLPYSGDNFELHQGVSSVFAALLPPLTKETFSLLFIYAPERYGKTHLLVKTSDALSKQGIFHKVSEGAEFGSLAYELQTGASKNTIPQAILIDNIESYLISVEKGQSGEFVSFIEWCRLNRIPISLFSSRRIEDFPSDDHVKSRLRAGIQLDIKEPEDEDITTVIRALAKQRGVKLSDRNLNFLTKRLERDIPSLERYVDRLLHLSQVLGKSIKFNLVSDAV